MPLFEFVCKKCGSKFEKIVFSIDKEKIECPECKSKDVEKQFSVFSAGSSETNKPMRVSCQEKKSSGCCNGCCHHHHH